MDLDIFQESAVKTNYDKVLVIAGAGSGKTKTLTERVKYLLETGVPSEKIAAITFTNIAAQEMRMRLPAFFNGYIGTLHSLASKFLEDNSIKSDVWYYKSNKFDELIKAGSKYAKNTYDYVLVDEFQDICDEEYAFIESIEAKSYFLVGDDWQGIYQFKGANPNIFLNLIEKEEWHKFYLLYNYRSNTKICSYGFNIISNVKKKVNKYMTVSNQKEGAVYLSTLSQAIKILKKDGNFKDWLIITRLNEEVDFIKGLLDKEGIPSVGFKKSQLDMEKLTNFMESNVVKVLTIHSAKGLESKNVVVYRANRSGGQEELRIAYVAATRAKENLYWCDKIIKPKHNLVGLYLNTRGV